MGKSLARICISSEGAKESLHGLALLEAIDNAECVVRVRASKVGWRWAVYTFVGIPQGLHSVFFEIFLLFVFAFAFVFGLVFERFL